MLRLELPVNLSLSLQHTQIVCLNGKKLPVMFLCKEYKQPGKYSCATAKKNYLEVPQIVEIQIDQLFSIEFQTLD